MTPLETTFYRLSIAYMSLNFLIILVLIALAIYLFLKIREANRRIKELSKMATFFKLGSFLLGIVTNLRRRK